MNVPEKPSSIRDRLRTLPAAVAPPCDWTEFRRRTAPDRARHARRAGGRPALAALAAAVLLAVAGLAWWQRIDAPPAGGAVHARFRLPVTPERAAGGATAMEFARAARLAGAAPRAALIRVDTHAPVAALEDRIAWVDDALSIESIEGAPPARLAALEHERARLLDALVRVRYAETLSAMTR